MLTRCKKMPANVYGNMHWKVVINRFNAKSHLQSAKRILYLPMSTFVKLYCSTFKQSNILFSSTTIFQPELPLQVNPSPMYSGRQVQVKLPGVLIQVASGLQAPLFTAHSSISTSSQDNMEWNSWTEVRQVQYLVRENTVNVRKSH